MKVYLAGTASRENLKNIYRQGKYYLESFQYFKPWQKMLINEDFMMDSGAFTFIENKNKAIDWDKYIYNYAQAIKEYGISLFLELDIDVIVGLKEVERMREELEKLTKKKCIPVWHKERDKDYFLHMVKAYDYVAFGELGIGEMKEKDYPELKWFISKAHENDCKIHALGFTRQAHIRRYNFDSIDSSSWTAASRFGISYEFTGSNLIQRKCKKSRLGNCEETERNNFRQWILFQKYAENNL